MPTQDISVLIPTFNEERNLERCLRACSWSDDIVVFDSFSTDRTIEIAKDFGARVFQRKFDNEPSQRLASLRVPFKHPWVFNPDADEVATPEFCQEMFAAVASASSDVTLFRMRRKDMFQGKWIKHSSVDPWIARLYRPETISFERVINMTYKTTGTEARLNQRLIHYAFEKGMDDWLDKHNRYSRAEAAESLAALDKPSPSLSQLLSGDPVVRRRAIKDLSARVPFRPLARFLVMYIVRRGFLDGSAGFRYCCLVGFYEFMIVLKAEELLQNRKQGSL
jgi:glycosyltransferase involved in cell wall biosynthesis